MKEKLLFIFIIFAFFSFSSRVFAVESCSPKGYTILTINGIFTDLEGAIRNKDSLSFKFSKPFNNQSIKVDYLYNPSHLAGLADLIDTVKQGFFDQKSDYDLVEMLNDASQKVTTQKLLLVAHSQGNFYANNFYDKTASQPGGVPSQSIGVYGVASPTNRVTGGGKYLTSDTDNVIASVVARYINILSPNIHIPLSSLDGNGHSFSDVYLKYQGDRIVSDIKSSLDKLKENDEQIPQDPCISPPELSVIHKVQGVVLAVADPLAGFTKTIAVNTVVTSYKVASALGNSVLDGVSVAASSAVDTVVGSYKIASAIGNGVLNGVSSAASAITSLFNNNKNLALNIPAAAGLAIDQGTNQEIENIIPKIVKDSSQPVVTKPKPSDNVSNVSSDKINVIKNPAPVIIDPVVPPADTVPVVTPKIISSNYHSGGSGPVYIAPPDNTPPVIFIIGADSLDVTKDTVYTDASATAIDDVDGDLTSTIVKSGTFVDTATIGTYTIIYTATDLAGNISSLTRTVKVVATPDVTAPVISIIDDESSTIVVGSTYTDAGATALDEKDGDITANIVTFNPVDVNTVADYTVTYNVKDLAKNSATQVVRLVHVISLPDITPPVITILGNNPEIIKLGSAYSDAGAEAVDEKDGEVSVVITGAVKKWVLGTYTITYTAKDSAENEFVSTRTVNVVDVIPTMTISSSDLNNNGITDNTETDVVVSSNMSLNAGEYHFNNLTITNNAVLTLKADLQSANTFKGVKIVANNLTIDSGSSISANGKGYGNGLGTPIGSNSWAGGSYGGIGELNTSAFTYGSAKEPIDLGSGGQDGYNGGGAIRVVVTDTLTNNGILSANGNANASGGSIYVNAKNINGNGSFNTNGGDPHNNYRHGAGGRIALYYESISFTGKSDASGGCGIPDGSTQICTGDGTVGFFDIANDDFYAYTSWRFQTNDSPFNFNNITLTDGAKVATEKEVNITANNLLVDKAAQFTLAEDQVVSIPLITINGGSTLTLSKNETFTTDTLTVIGNSTITVAPQQILSFTVTNLNVDAGSLISANGKGYKNGTGPGAAIDPHYYAGASYGGIGWDNNLASVYGSETEPIDFGSSGTGVRVVGGGAIRIIINNILTNNGTISANGDSTSSGGSIYVTTKSFIGNGTFSANGGAGECGNTCNGPGGGGRVAIYYETSSFIGNVKALGTNSGDRKSGAGTVKLIDTSVIE